MFSFHSYLNVIVCKKCMTPLLLDVIFVFVIVLHTSCQICTMSTLVIISSFFPKF